MPFKGALEGLGPRRPRQWQWLCIAGATFLAGCDGEAATVKAPRMPVLVTQPSPTNQAASDFVVKAMGDDLFEFQAAQVAAVRAKSPDVKAFAAMTAQESTASRAQLARSVADSGQPLAAPTGLSDHLQSMLSQLDRGTPKDFDKTYIEQQIEADEDALSLMSAYGRDGGVPAIRAAAAALEPARQSRLDRARSIQDSLNKAL